MSEMYKPHSGEIYLPENTRGKHRGRFCVLWYNNDSNTGFRYAYNKEGGLALIRDLFNHLQTQYTYDSSWADLLTGYGTDTITYDTIGNPLTYRDGYAFTWQRGRQLAGYTKGTDTASYTYDESGIRLSKTVNGNTTTFYVVDGVLLGQKFSDNKILQYLYDDNGTKYGFIYDGTTYFYDLNLQGDVVGIIDTSGNTVVSYTYDPWGKVLSVTGTLASTIGQINPIRYRGYYYDSETRFYYLQSRYYDPETGRFINADGQIMTGDDILGCNLFAYCGNNPVNRADPAGEFWGLLTKVIVKKLVKATIVVGSVFFARAIIKKTKANNKEADYNAVDKLLKDRTITNEVVKLPYDKDNLLYNKENRQYASKIIKNDLGPSTNRTIEDISSEVFAHEFVADVLYPTIIFKGIAPSKYDVYTRLSEADIDEHEGRIFIFNALERMFG